MSNSRYFLSAGSFRRVALSFSQSARTCCRDVYSHHTPYPSGIAYNGRRFYSFYKVTRGEFSSHMLRDVRRILWRSNGMRVIHFSSTSSRLSYGAQVAWRWFFEIYSYTGPILPPISRIACAISLSLSRSHLLAPGILALVIGEFTLNERSLAHADYSPPKDILVVPDKEWHAYLTSLAFSLLEGLALILRAFYLTVVFSPCILMAPLAESLGIQFRRSWIRGVRVTLEKAGPAFIKWGQWAAARPDLFPNDLCNELAELHTTAPAHSFAYTKRTIEKAFGRKLCEIFDNFEEEPVASGSVAQVHRATLRQTYLRQQAKPIAVAVKVRHPGVSEAIRRDFVLIDLFAKMSKFIPTLKWLRLDESIQQFAVFMLSQVDLAREAANLSRFIYNFRHSKDVSFPKPIYPFVHPSVLVETYEHGASILQYVDKLKGHEKTKTALAHIGTNALLKMLLEDNFIHADMHPGNILVREFNGKNQGKTIFRSRPHVVFLDVGMTAELSRKDRDNLLAFFKAVVLRDGRTAAECTLKLSDNQNCPYPKAFIEEVDDTFKYWGSDEGHFVHPADCIQQMLEQVRRHRVNIDGNICTVIVTTMVLEGWQRKLDPSFDVMQTMRALLFKADWADSISYTIGGLMAP